MNTLRIANDPFQLAGKVFIYVGPIASIAVSAGLFFLGAFRLAILSLYIVLPVIVTTVVFSRWNLTASGVTGYRLGRIKYKGLSVVFWLAITALLFKLYISGPRDSTFFIFFVLAGTVLLSQILYVNLTQAIVYDLLFRQIVLLLVAVWGLSLNYPYYTGGTDILVHVWLVNQFLAGVPPAEWGSIYSSFPLWHFLVAGIKQLLGPTVEIRTVAFVFGGLSFIAVPLFVYVTAKQLFGSGRSALAASLFVIFNSYVIYYGAYSIPRSTALLFFVAVIYYFYRSQSKRSLILLVLFSALIVVFHPSSPPFILPILSLAILLKYVSSSQNPLKQHILYLVLFGVGVIAYWVFYSEVLITAIVTTLFMSTSESISSGTPSLGITVQTYLEFVPYAVLLLFIFTSFLETVITSHSDRQKQFVLVTIIVAVISFPNPLTLIEKVQQLNFQRWGIYTPAFISVAAGVGLVRLKSKGKRLQYGVLLLFVVFSFTVVLTPQISADSSDFNHDVQSPYLNDQAIAAIEHGAEFSDGNVLSDYIVSRYIESSRYTAKESILVVNGTTGKIYPGPDSNVILLREDAIENKVLKFHPGDKYLYKPSPAGIFSAEREDINIPVEVRKIYDSGGTEQYT